MSEIKVNKISPRTACGTVTLGDSGDTFTIPAGATITNSGTASGFGRTGTVDWQTGSIKTTTFTAANGEGYFVNTSGGAITANLPAGSAGAIVAFSDYTRTFATNRLTITPNGSEKIGGVTASTYLNVNGQAITLIYVDGTEGWINIQNAEDTEIGIVPAFVTATGGTITTVCTNYKVHTFTGPGTFCVSNAGNIAGSDTVSYMVVAGGAGGGKGDGGGGGAGGFREGRTPTCSYTVSPLNAPAGLPVSTLGYPITVGGGGSGGAAPTPNGNGSNGNSSIFSSITSTGGGGGGGACNPGVGATGGSGGGASQGGVTTGGAGNTPPVSPPQGNAGGNNGGGGGGATAAGGNNGGGVAGGAGATTHIPGSPLTKAAGGLGDQPGGSAGPSGAANSGGGGGGICNGGPGPGPGGTGGSGIVIIRYQFQ